MTDEIITGIQRRLDGWGSESGSDFVMQKLLASHGLPPADGGLDRVEIAMHAELFELIERYTDAAEAGREADVAFINRQILAVIGRLKEHFSSSRRAPVG